MDRTMLVAEAREAGLTAAHNLRVIKKMPNKMLPGKAGDAEIYLNNMIRLSKLEIKNDRRLGQSQLSTRLKYLVASILTRPRQNRKERAM